MQMYQKDYLINIYIIVLISFLAFLFSNTFILISAPLYLIIFIMMLKVKIEQRSLFFFVITLSLFYLFYYSVFLGYPYLLLQLNEVNEPFGQLYKYYLRADKTLLSIKPFVENFKLSNFYSFPLIYYLISLWFLKSFNELIFQ